MSFDPQQQQQQSLSEEIKRHRDSAARRNDEAAIELRAADEAGDWDRVLKCHQRKMRAGAQRELLAGAMDLVEHSGPIQRVLSQLEDNLARSRATVLATARAANATAASGQLAHEHQPPQFDQDWSNLSYALGQDLMLAHIVNFARYATQTPLTGGAALAQAVPVPSPWVEAQTDLAEELASLASIDESLKEQQQHWQVQRRSAIQDHDETLADRASDSLNNLGGQRDSVAEMIRILSRGRMESPAERRAAAVDLEELGAFGQAQQSAWQVVFSELIAERDVARGESANGFLNHANGYMVQALRASSLANSLRATFE